MKKTSLPDIVEDALIHKVAERFPDIGLRHIFDLEEAGPVDCFQKEFVQKAWSCFNVVLTKGKCRISPPNISRKDFYNGFLSSWARFILNSAAVSVKAAPLQIFPAEVPRIIYIYHYSSYPFLENVLKQYNILAVVRRIAPWMTSGQHILIDDPDILQKILLQLKQGGRIAAMLDFSYPSTRNHILNFLGLSARIPVGLFKIAHWQEIDVGLMVPNPEDSSSFRIHSYKSSEFTDPLILAQELLDRLSDSILERPAEWMLWPNVNHLWNFKPL